MTHQLSRKCPAEVFFPALWNSLWLFLTCICSWSSPAMFVPVSSVPGLHGIPARRAPMVEQAVQTVPLASTAQKRGKTSTQPQGRQPARPTQRSGRGGSQVQKENVPTSKQTLTKSLALFLAVLETLFSLQSSANKQHLKHLIYV